MPAFEENLQNLKQPHEQIQALEGYADGYEPAFIILNKPGSQGAMAIYYEVAVRHGGLTPKAAEHALELFAEHTEAARAHPGTHPNIDRLFTIIEQDLFYSIKAIPKNRA